MLAENRRPGVSFIVRARNEAYALFKNILSLRTLTIPHEIVVVLHRCTDSSQAVLDTWAAQAAPIVGVVDNEPASRPGYETLVTPRVSPRSFSSFSQRAIQHARYNWIVRWDADFVATPFLIDFLNTTLALDYTEPASYQLACSLGGDLICHEEYMFNTFLGCGKYICWENYLQKEPRISTVMQFVCIETGTPRLIKEYWRESPWFLQADTYDKDIARKYEKLIEICGPEPAGFARSNSPDFDAQWNHLIAKMPELVAAGIDPEN